MIRESVFIGFSVALSASWALCCLVVYRCGISNGRLIEQRDRFARAILEANGNLQEQGRGGIAGMVATDSPMAKR